MSLKHMQLVIDHSRTRGSDRVIMLVLAFRASEKDRPRDNIREGECYPGLTRLAADTGLTRRTVTRRLPAIEATGELLIERRGQTVRSGGGPQRSNLYRITMAPPKGRDGQSPPLHDKAGTQSPQGRDSQSPEVGTDSPTGRDRVTPEPKENHQDEPSSKGASRGIEIHDYEDIHNPEHDAITVALEVTHESRGGQAEGFLRKALKTLGHERFRRAAAEVWGEMKNDGIRKPGAILTNKLKALMARARTSRAGDEDCQQGKGVRDGKITPHGNDRCPKHAGTTGSPATTPGDRQAAQEPPPRAVRPLPHGVHDLQAGIPRMRVFSDACIGEG